MDESTTPYPNMGSRMAPMQAMTRTPTSSSVPIPDRSTSPTESNTFPPTIFQPSQSPSDAATDSIIPTLSKEHLVWYPPAPFSHAPTAPNDPTTSPTATMYPTASSSPTTSAEPTDLMEDSLHPTATMFPTASSSPTASVEPSYYLSQGSAFPSSQVPSMESSKLHSPTTGPTATMLPTASSSPTTSPLPTYILPTSQHPSSESSKYTLSPTSSMLPTASSSPTTSAEPSYFSLENSRIPTPSDTPTVTIFPTASSSPTTSDLPTYLPPSPDPTKARGYGTKSSATDIQKKTSLAYEQSCPGGSQSTRQDDIEVNFVYAIETSTLSWGIITEVELNLLNELVPKLLLCYGGAQTRSFFPMDHDMAIERIGYPSERAASSSSPCALTDPFALRCLIIESTIIVSSTSRSQDATRLDVISHIEEVVNSGKLLSEVPTLASLLYLGPDPRRITNAMNYAQELNEASDSSTLSTAALISSIAVNCALILCVFAAFLRRLRSPSSRAVNKLWMSVGDIDGSGGQNLAATDMLLGYYDSQRRSEAPEVQARRVNDKHSNCCSPRELKALKKLQRIGSFQGSTESSGAMTIFRSPSQSSMSTRDKHSSAGSSLSSSRDSWKSGYARIAKAVSSSRCQEGEKSRLSNDGGIEPDPRASTAVRSWKSGPNFGKEDIGGSEKPWRESLPKPASNKKTKASRRASSSRNVFKKKYSALDRPDAWSSSMGDNLSPFEMERSATSELGERITSLSVSGRTMYIDGPQQNTGQE